MMRSGKPFLTWMDGYNGGLKLIKQGIGKYTILHPPRLHGSGTREGPDHRVQRRTRAKEMATAEPGDHRCEH